MSTRIDNPPPSRWERCLSETIVAQVIPRLYAAHCGDGEQGAGAARRLPDFGRDSEADRFLGLVLSDSRDSQWEHLLQLRDSGMNLETILLDIMAPAIRHIGEMWADDRMSFVEVTAKSARLQQMLRALGTLRDSEASREGGERSLLLAGVPGEQHTFGLFVLAELFLKAGWSVAVEIAASLDDLRAAVSRRPFDAVGLSVGSERFLPPLAGQVAALRSASAAANTRIFLGGWAFTQGDTSLDAYGVDLIETNARAAVARASLLCPLGGRLPHPDR
ncbi:B12-binding domain-containing protein [Jiella sp. M17.18]|uniref:cobalamin B12-binding domain-containing protein n=1 Tax=Jiella sp. M17.18 TaxID=3234247 RepID=UPI0034E00EDA